MRNAENGLSILMLDVEHTYSFHRAKPKLLSSSIPMLCKGWGSTGSTGNHNLFDIDVVPISWENGDHPHVWGSVQLYLICDVVFLCKTAHLEVSDSLQPSPANCGKISARQCRPLYCPGPLGAPSARTSRCPPPQQLENRPPSEIPGAAPPWGRLLYLGPFFLSQSLIQSVVVRDPGRS